MAISRTIRDALDQLPGRARGMVGWDGTDVQIIRATTSGYTIVASSGGGLGDGVANPTSIQDASGSAAPLAIGSFGYVGASLWDRIRTPNVIKRIEAVAVTAATGATIWTPAAGKKFRLMGWSLSSSAAAALIFGDNLVGTVILRTELLAAAGVSQTAPGFGNGFLSAAADNVLKLDVTANSTVSGYVFGCEE